MRKGVRKNRPGSKLYRCQTIDQAHAFISANHNNGDLIRNHKGTNSQSTKCLISKCVRKSGLRARQKHS